MGFTDVVHSGITEKWFDWKCTENEQQDEAEARQAGLLTFALT